MGGWGKRFGWGLFWLGCCALCLPAGADSSAALSGGQGRPISIVARDVPIAEIFEMLSRKERANILLGKGITGSISVSLFDVSLDQAIRSIAESAGYVAERRGGAYIIIERGEAGRDAAPGNTVTRALKVQYSDPKTVSDILSSRLSRYGEITVFEKRRLLVVEDLPEFVQRIKALLAEVDQQPNQILIETKILEITLDENEVFGIDWEKLFTRGEGTGSFGVRGLTTPGATGLFFDLVTPNIEAALSALSSSGRVRTLSTPTLLALEHEEAEVVIGDRLGFRVTTTINQVTTESIEFLESGVILKFKAAVDRQGRIMLEIHPEVSTGVITNGLPSQTTAELTTTLLAEDGQKIFMGGLIKDRTTKTRTGVPLLKDLPLVGRLFARDEFISVNSETVVVITVHVVGRQQVSQEKMMRLSDVEQELRERRLGGTQSFEPRPQAPEPPETNEPPQADPAGEDEQESGPSQ